MPQIISGSKITSTAQVADNAIATADLQDDAVTVAKVANGTDAQLLRTVGTDVAWESPVAVSAGAGDSGKIPKLDATGKLDPTFVNIARTVGVYDKNSADASTTQDITHGLGTTPGRIKITALWGATSKTSQSHGVYYVVANTHKCILRTVDASGAYASNDTASIVFTTMDSGNTARCVGVITAVTSTIFTITWTKTGSPTGTVTFLWEAEA